MSISFKNITFHAGCVRKNSLCASVPLASSKNHRSWLIHQPMSVYLQKNMYVCKIIALQYYIFSNTDDIYIWSRFFYSFLVEFLFAFLILFCGEFLASWAASTTSPKEAKLSLIELRRRDLSAWTSSRWHFWFWQGQRKCQSPFCHLSWKPNKDLELLRRMTSFDHTLVLHCVFIYLYLHLSLSLSLSLLRPQDSSPSKLHNDLSMMDGMRKQTLSGVLCRQLLTKLTHDINGPLRTFFGSHKGRLAILTSVQNQQKHKASKSLSPPSAF